MTWEMLSALIVIVGTLVSLGTVLAKLIRVLTQLDDTVKQLRADLDRQREENRESRKRIYDRLDDHESRIVELERNV